MQLRPGKKPYEYIQNIGKVYIFSYLKSYFEKILSRYQFGFWKGYNTPQCLFVLPEKWCQSLDKGEHYGALLTGLSKAFDYLCYDLLITKLHAYVFNIPALRLFHNHHTNGKQRVKIDSIFSSWEGILAGVPQDSVLGPLLFNFFL